MSSIRERRRKRIKCYDRQDGKCYYCKRQLNLINPKSKTYATIEHIKERRQGGTWALKNLAVACKRCNNRQGWINTVFLEIIDVGIKDILTEKYPDRKGMLVPFWKYLNLKEAICASC